MPGRFDDDPFPVPARPGRAEEESPDAPHGPVGDAAPDDPPHVADVPLAERLDDFYSPSLPLARLRPRPAEAAAPRDILLRALEPPPIKVRHIPLADILRPAYRALGEEEPSAAKGEDRG